MKLEKRFKNAINKTGWILIIAIICFFMFFKHHFLYIIPAGIWLFLFTFMFLIYMDKDYPYGVKLNEKEE